MNSLWCRHARSLKSVRLKGLEVRASLVACAVSFWDVIFESCLADNWTQRRTYHDESPLPDDFEDSNNVSHLGSFLTVSADSQIRTSSYLFYNRPRPCEILVHICHHSPSPPPLNLLPMLTLQKHLNPRTFSRLYPNSSHRPCPPNRSSTHW